MEKISATIILFSISLLACQKEDVKLISGCCELPPPEAPIGNALIYFPNIFTPNGDGENEILYLSGDSIKSIIEFKVTNKRGDLVFEANHINANDALAGWDGSVNGVVKKGLYDVSVTVQAEDGSVGSLHARVCNFPCGETDEVSLLHCLYPDYWSCLQNFDHCLNAAPFSKCSD